MKKTFILALLVLSSLGISITASAAPPRNRGGAEAYACYVSRAGSGAVGSNSHFNCGKLGENLTIGDIYSKGYRVVSHSVVSYEIGSNSNMTVYFDHTLIIERNK